MAYYNGKKVMAVVDYKPAILIEKEITKGGEYNASDDNADGYSKVIVGAVKPEGNPLQYVIDNQGGDGVPSCETLFNNYKGSSLDSALKGIDISNVKNFRNMFTNCNNLISIPELDSSSATNMDSMFSYCKKLTTINQLETYNVTSMQDMFYNCQKLSTIPLLDTSNVTNMNGMFRECIELITIPQLNTSKVTNMGYMFNNCKKLTTIPLLDTSNVTNMNSMLSYCKSLTNFPALDVTKCKDFNSLFYNCTSLTSIGMYGFTRSISITYTALEHDAIVALLNQAGTAYDSSQKITLGSDKLALLSDEEKAIATNKGWTLA